MNGKRSQIFNADSQLLQTPAECIDLFHLLNRDHREKELLKYTFVLSEMIHFVFQRFDLQQFFHSAVVLECIIHNGSDKHCEH